MKQKSEDGIAIEVDTRQWADDVEGPTVCLRPAGTGDYGSADGHGWPVIVEIFDGVPILHVWADINQEDPTHRIDLRGAYEAHRRPDGQTSPSRIYEYEDTYGAPQKQEDDQ